MLRNNGGLRRIGHGVHDRIRGNDWAGAKTARGGPAITRRGKASVTMT